MLHSIAVWYFANPVPAILISTFLLVTAPFVAYLLRMGAARKRS